MKKLLTYLFCLAGLSSFGQGSLDDEITIINEYKPQLADAVKKNPKARIPALETDKPELVYDVPEEYLNLQYAAPEVKPLAMPTEPPEPVPNVFAKVGAGNHALPFLDIYLNSGLHNNKRSESNKTVWTVHAGYINSPTGALQNQKFSELRTSASIKQYFESVLLSGGVFFDQDMVHFYGYDNDSFSFPAGQVRQVFNYVGGNIRLMNASANRAKITHDTHLRAGYLTDRFGQRELNPVLTMQFGKTFRSKNQLHIKGLVDYASFASDSMSLSGFIGALNPTFRFQRDIWFAEGGINLGADQLGFFFFPDLAFERQLLGKGFVIYAGWDGAPEKNTLRRLSSTNPFLAKNPLMIQSREQDRFIGFKGNPTQGFGYNIKVSNKFVRNLPMFLNDTADFSRFRVVYDSAALINQVHGEVSIGHGERLRMIFSGDFFTYALNNQLQPWHMPALSGKVRTAYQVTERLGLSLDVFGFGKTLALDANGLQTTLKGTADINVGGTFKMAESFFIFANVNNVASMKHQRWYNYPGYGLSFVGGLGLSF